MSLQINQTFATVNKNRRVLSLSDARRQASDKWRDFFSLNKQRERENNPLSWQIETKGWCWIRQTDQQINNQIWTPNESKINLTTIFSVRSF